MTTSEDQSIQELLLGRTIVDAYIAPDSGDKWSDSQNEVTLTLDDGAGVVFRSWGHDANGVDTAYLPPPGEGGSITAAGDTRRWAIEGWCSRADLLEDELGPHDADELVKRTLPDDAPDWLRSAVTEHAGKITACTSG